MAEGLDETMSETQARVDGQSRLLQATMEELETDRSSRRGDRAEAGREPGLPAIAASDRVEYYLSHRFVEQVSAAAERGGAVGATSSPTTVSLLSGTLVLKKQNFDVQRK